jgi:hypothetical protein
MYCIPLTLNSPLGLFHTQRYDLDQVTRSGRIGHGMPFSAIFDSNFYYSDIHRYQVRKEGVW